jgi:hypothetical protein
MRWTLYGPLLKVDNPSTFHLPPPPKEHKDRVSIDIPVCAAFRGTESKEVGDDKAARDTSSFLPSGRQVRRRHIVNAAWIMLTSPHGFYNTPAFLVCWLSVKDTNYITIL